MERILEKLDDLLLSVLKADLEITLNDFNTASAEDICELRYSIEKINREVMKLENITLVKLYNLVRTGNAALIASQIKPTDSDHQ